MSSECGRRVYFNYCVLCSVICDACGTGIRWYPAVLGGGSVPVDVLAVPGTCTVFYFIFLSLYSIFETNNEGR